MSKQKFYFGVGRTLIIGGVVLAFIVGAFIKTDSQISIVDANDLITSEDHDVQGYAWSENIGWISMRSEENDHWELVRSLDEEKYIYTNSSTYQKDAYNLEDTNQTGSINGVNLYMEGQGCIIPYARISGNDGPSGSAVCSNGGGFITSNLNHPTGDDWSWEDINNLQAVIELKSFNGNQGQIKYAYVEVFYDSDSIILAPNSTGDFSEIEGRVPAKYGVTLKSDGFLEGYAWSENVGWISFNPLDLGGCPSGDCEAKIDINTEKFSGWAKVLNSGEWISLSGNTGDGGEYGIELVGNEFQGWAWGGDVIGWISLNCQNQDTCSQSNYNVSIDLSAISPEIIFEEINESSYCNQSTPPVWLDWLYINNGSTPEKIDIQITKGSDFENDEQCGSECVLDLNGIDYSEGDFYIGDSLVFDNDYLARIRVEDEYGNISSWAIKEFETQIKYPETDFSWAPDLFYPDQKVFFEDNTNYYQWSDPLNRVDDINLTWEFPESALEERIEGTRSEAEEVFNEFNKMGSFEVSLEVKAQIKDNESNTTEQTCQISKTIRTGRGLPHWRETY
jgi:hypothetical protein